MSYGCLLSDKPADALLTPVHGEAVLSQKSIICKPLYQSHGKHLEFLIIVSRLREKIVNSHN